MNATSLQAEWAIHRASPLIYAIALPATSKAAKANRGGVIRTVLGTAGIKVKENPGPCALRPRAVPWNTGMTPCC